MNSKTRAYIERFRVFPIDLIILYFQIHAIKGNKRRMPHCEGVHFSRYKIILSCACLILV